MRARSASCRGQAPVGLKSAVSLVEPPSPERICPAHLEATGSLGYSNKASTGAGCLLARAAVQGAELLGRFLRTDCCSVAFSCLLRFGIVQLFSSTYTEDSLGLNILRLPKSQKVYLAQSHSSHFSVALWVKNLLPEPGDLYSV